jgi:predicted nucleotidyltransferase
LETLTVQDIKTKARPVFARRRITKAGVFGSFAKGNATTNSNPENL